MSDWILTCQGLHKSFQVGRRLIEVLRGVDLRLARGEWLSVVGASGAGKSTLLNVLAGLEHPNSGTVELDGVGLYALNRGNRARLRGRRIGFVFQAYHLLPELDALENVMLPARILRTPNGEVTRRANYLLELVGLGQRVSHRPDELSGGEQQRVAIARGLMNRPDLLFADEPTGNLDSTTGAQVLDMLRQACKESGASLVLVTHDEGVSRQFPNVVHMVDGRLTDAPPAEDFSELKAGAEEPAPDPSAGG